MALFGHCGTVTQIRIAGDPSYDTRYAFIEFTTPEESQTAMMLDGMNVFDRQIRVNMARGGSGPGIVRSNDPDRVQRTIHIGGLPFDELSEDTIAEYFSHVGEVNAVRKSGRFAWVEFQTLQAAQTAMSLDGESLGTGTMKVSASKTPIHTAGWRAQKFRDQPGPATPAGSAVPPLPSPQPPPMRPPMDYGRGPGPAGPPPSNYGPPPPSMPAPPAYQSRPPPPAMPPYAGPTAYGGGPPAPYAAPLPPYGGAPHGYGPPPAHPPYPRGPPGPPPGAMPPQYGPPQGYY
ncbi:probable polyadenylate-binding protein-interacting protein 8 at N-terminal half [Coccomyxa sp. Obi]|nr:probable polyadenylate-binding protein-interacting protein 8 at N-terminal half [Coccomyxa sp. Obi]